MCSLRTDMWCGQVSSPWTPGKGGLFDSASVPQLLAQNIQPGPPAQVSCGLQESGGQSGLMGFKADFICIFWQVQIHILSSSWFDSLHLLLVVSSCIFDHHSLPHLIDGRLCRPLIPSNFNFLMVDILICWWMISEGLASASRSCSCFRNEYSRVRNHALFETFTWSRGPWALNDICTRPQVHCFLTNPCISIYGTSAKPPPPRATPTFPSNHTGFQATSSLRLETSLPDETQQDDKDVQLCTYLSTVIASCQPINIGPWFNFAY